MKKCKACNLKLVKKKNKNSRGYYMPKTYCSKECHDIGQKTGKTMVDVLCNQCGKIRSVSLSYKKMKFCSQKCYREHNRGKNHQGWKGELPNCVDCGKTLSLHKLNKCLQCRMRDESIRAKISKLKAGKPNLKMRGKNNPQYIDGRTPLHTRIRNSVKYKTWAILIKKRDNFECQICGVRRGFLHSNHIKRFADYPKLRFNLDNGITICRDCDYKWVLRRELEWESYFNFNLITRGLLVKSNIYG